MSYPQPTTTVKLCSGINFDNSYKNTLYFSSLSAQTNWFDTMVTTSFSNQTYQRYGLGGIKVHARLDSILSCNYLFFNNTSYENKRYYAFITKLEYINEETTLVLYEIDEIQTYMFNWTLKNSFVERQHSTTDSAGDNIIEENVNLGDYIYGSCSDLNFTDMYLLIQTDVRICNDSGQFDISGLIAPTAKDHSGIVDGCCITVARPSLVIGSTFLATLVNTYANHIINMWFYPSNFINATFYNSVAPFTETFTITQSIQNALTRPTTLNGYTPKNKKLLTYPYCFLQVSNNNGQTMDLKYERWTNNNPDFLAMGTSTGEARVLLTPRFYNNEPSNFAQTEVGVMSASYPTMSYTGDSYSIYLAQNRNTLTNNMDIIQRNYNLASQQLGMNTLMGGLGAVGQIASGNIGAGVANLGASGTNYAMQKEALNVGLENQVSSAMASLEDMKTRPNTVSGIQSVGVNIQNGKNGFTQYVKTIDYQHARCIDEYFTMYGYAQKRVMTPNINARSQYTFIKTIGLNITGDFPNDDKAKIIRIFDNGITFWKANSSIGDYSVVNT